MNQFKSGPSINTYNKLSHWFDLSNPGILKVYSGKIDIGQHISSTLALIASKITEIKYDQIEIIRFLLGNSVNIHATDNDGDSALHYAGKAQTAQILIEVGKANPNQVNQEGKTPLDAKQEEMNEMMEDEDIEDDDEDLENVKGIVLYLSKLC